MAEVKVRLVGHQRVANFLRWAAAKFPEVVDGELKQTITNIWREAQTYEAPPTETYRRTGYMSRMTVMGRAPGMARGGWYAEMRASYSRYVRGLLSGLGQAWMHVGRWNLWRDIVRKYTRDLPGRLARKLGEFLRRRG